MRVLLTSPRAPVTLDLARRFRRRGDEVYVCDSIRFPCARFSNAVKRSVLTAAPGMRLKSYLDSINQLIKSEKIDLLIPTCEEIFYLAKFKDQIECEIFADSISKLETIHSKWKFSQAVSSALVKAPESFQLHSPLELDDFLSKNQSTEFVFKPVYSRFAAETLITPSLDKMERMTISKQKPWLAQRYIDGQEFSTYSIAQQGKLVAHSTYRSLFRAGLGSGICFQTECIPVITKFVKEFVRQFNFTGQIGFDFMMDREQQVWVLEANPRATSGLHLFDETDQLIDAILGNAVDRLIEPCGSTRKQVVVAMLSFGFQGALRSGNLSSYFHSLFTVKDVIFCWRDLLPSFVLPLTVAELGWVALRQGVGLQKASTLGIEYDGCAMNPKTAGVGN